MTEPLGQRGALPMTCPTLLTAVVEALRSAGAAEEIIAAAVKAGGKFCDSPPRQRGRRLVPLHPQLSNAALVCKGL